MYALEYEAAMPLPPPTPREPTPQAKPSEVKRLQRYASGNVLDAASSRPMRRDARGGGGTAPPEIHDSFDDPSPTRDCRARRE